MNEDEGEATLSISLVDGISCGLAATLLLFIIFGVNISVSTSSLGGQAGHGTVTKVPSDLTREPVDIIVEVRGPTSAIAGNSPWRSQSSADHRVVNALEGKTVFVRELRGGFSTPNGVQANHGDIDFNLTWQGPVPFKGVIHIFRSGTDSAFDFECHHSKGPYAIIQGFDLKHAVLRSACNWKPHS
ncbi:hypothetical protein RQ479_21180 [Mesorhizobium sp. ISC25]|uniref:hypothetical protein n=1 Tax=Mesorhizobium sp. ISC25 TaxID=3077335 RepID=UPI0035DA7B94